MTLRTTWPPAAANILDAADRLLVRSGYRKMTVDDLAEEAGIGKGTVYLSFESKAEVALACIDRMVARLLERLQAIAGRPGQAQLRLHAMLVERVMHRFEYARPHSASLDALLGAIRPQLLEHRREYFRAEARVFSAVMTSGCESGELDVANPARAARGFITATNALLPYSLSVEELGQRSETRRRVDDLAHLLLHGIVAGPTPERSSQRSARMRISR